jgi:hypothetical protein
MTRISRRALPAAMAIAALAAPATAQAHGINGSAEPGIPAWLFAWGAAAVLAISFAALAALWREPRLQTPHERRWLSIPHWPKALGGLIGVLVFLGIVYAGIAGAQEELDNVVPTWVFVVFWVFIPVVSGFLGDVFRLFNPWLAIARGIRVIGRLSGAEAEPLPYPAWLGRWPAVFTIVGFGWLELVYSDHDNPSTLAILGIVYAVVQLVGMSLYGIEQWEENADGFGVYFGMFARLAPLDWRDGALWLRRPLEGTVGMTMQRGTVALICAAIGITTFDGLSAGPLWTDIVPTAQRWGGDLGMSLNTSLELVSTLGLLFCIALIGGAYRFSVSGLEGGARSFAHTLIPIALAYIVAHYATLILFQGQAMAALVSDPLGQGKNWLGTADWQVNYSFIDATGIWFIQVAAVVVGHVGGLTLAHDTALARTEDPDEAARSQRAMLAIMVALTTLALWLISSSNQ